MKHLLVLTMSLALAGPAFGGSDIHKIDINEEVARYVVDNFVHRRSFDLCRRLGYNWYRIADTAEILGDPVLKEFWEAHDRENIVIFSHEPLEGSVGSISCKTVKEQQKAAAAARKAERKAAKRAKSQEKAQAKAEKEGEEEKEGGRSMR